MKMLYKPGKMAVVWNSIYVDYAIFKEDQIEKALSQGWHLSPNDFANDNVHIKETVEEAPRRRGRPPKSDLMKYIL